jgi:hypothetical protein
MFIQVVEGRVGNPAGLRVALDRWKEELAPGADGWLGATAGVTADGDFIGVVRFESEEAARANSDRPEQGEWWAAASANFESDVTFTNCPDVDTFGNGGSDDAGFVQVMKGRGDRAGLAAHATKTEAILSQARPDVLGGTVAWPGDGSFFQTIYFSSEAEARANEGREPASDEEREAWAGMSSLMQVDSYIDLSDPWLHSP